MIEARGIEKRFGRFQALKSVDLQCDRGRCTALIGPNGCGKTTLIKTLLGLVIPDKGQIVFDGSPVGRKVEYRNRIGYMPQMGRYPDNMTVVQVLNLIQGMRGIEHEQLDLELCETFGLPLWMNKRMSNLSGGMRQKVSAVLSLMFRPDVLILDEPTAGLDPISSEVLKERIILERERGCTILITSHLLAELEEVVTDVVYMQEGRVLFKKTKEELKESSGQSTLGRALHTLLKQNAAWVESSAS